MKQRKWVLIFALVIALIIVSVYTFWGAGINEKLRLHILAEIEPFVDPQSDIGSVHVDFGSLNLKRVTLISKDQQFDLQVREMKLGYNLIDLIRFGFSPEKIANQVILEYPQLTIRPVVVQPNRPETNTETRPMPDTPQLTEIRESIGLARYIEQFVVMDAEIHIENRQNQTICLAHQLDGVLLSGRADSAVVRMDGSLFESDEENLHLEGAVDLIDRFPLHMTMTLDESKPSPELPLFLPSFVQVTEGIMAGQGTYNRMDGASGFFELRDGTFSFQNAAFVLSRAGFRADLQSRNIRMTGRIGDFNGSPINLSGAIHNFWNPVLDIKAESDSFFVHRFLDQAMPTVRIPISGRARIDLQLIGSLNEPELIGSILSSNLDTPVLDLGRFMTSVWLKNRHLTIRSESTHPREGSAIRLNADMRFHDPKDPAIRAELALTGPFGEALPDWLESRISRVDSDLRFLVYGPLSNPEGKVDGRLHLVSRTNEILSLSPSFEYKNHACTGEITTDQNLRIQGVAEHVLTDAYLWRLDGEHLETLIHLILQDTWQERWGTGEVTASVSATRSDWHGRVDAVRRLPNDAIERLNVSADSEADPNQVSLGGTYRIGDGPTARLHSRMTIHQDRLTIEQFRADRFLKLDGQIPFQADLPFDVSIVLEALPTQFLYPYFQPLQAVDGELNGQIHFGGTGRYPDYHMDLALREGHLFQTGLFEGELIADLDAKGLNHLSMSLRRNDLELISGEIKRDAENDSLAGQFSGRDLLLGKDYMSFSPDGDWIQGMVNLDVAVFGLSKDPIIEGNLRFGTGSIGSLKMSDATVRFSDRSIQNDTIRSRIFFIEEGTVRSPDNLELRIRGTLPHRNDLDANLQISGQGNLFAPLLEMSSFFVRGEASGHFEAGLAGRPDAWVLGSLDATISEGTLELADFFPEIREIAGSISLVQGERFIQIDSLSGKVDGGLLHVSNVQPSDYPIRLHPLLLDTLGLSLGLLQIETPERGIVVHIPGLMESGESGRFRFSGLSSTETFTISGPAESPHIRGIFLMEDQRFTYPFLKGDNEEEADEILDKLAACTWQVRTIAAKDVHYVRSYLTPLGNVYLDLQLRESYGDLNFEGTPDQGDFEVWGTLASTEGTLDVLDYYFRPEQITFDYPKGADSPILRGRAYTTVIDSLGVPATVWLTITTLDETAGAQSGGALDQIYFRFETDNPNLGRTEADLLAAMGYSESSIRDRAYDALGLQVENLVFRPIFRPIEKQIRRHLGLDIVRVSSMFSRNLMQYQTSEEEVLDPKQLLRSTKLTLGKYLAPGFFITYSGQVQNDMGLQYTLHGLGFRHALALEYSIRPDLFLEMEYTYDSQLFSERREDKKIWLRHIFPF